MHEIISPLLSCQLVTRACFHGGRRSATGVIAGALFGAVWGFRGVAPPHLHDLEHLESLVHSGQSLFAVSNSQEPEKSPNEGNSVEAHERLV